MNNNEIEILDANSDSNNNVGSSVNTSLNNVVSQGNTVTSTNNNVPQGEVVTPVNNTAPQGEVVTPVNNTAPQGEVLTSVNNTAPQSEAVTTLNSIATQNEVVATVNSIPVETLPTAKKNKKGVKVAIIFVVVLLVVAIGGFFIYKETVLLNKKNIVKNSVIEMFNALDNGVETVNSNILPFDANEESIGIDGTFQASSNYKNGMYDLTKLSDYSIKYNSVLDLKNNKLSGAINLNKDNSPLLSVDTYVSGKYGLVQSKELSYYAYKYTLDREINEISVNNKNNYDDLRKVISRTKDFVVGKINEDNITKESVEETINGNKGNYIKFTYSVNMTELVNDVMRYYITDISVLNTIAEMTSTNAEELKSNIQKAINSNKDAVNIKYEIYVDGLFGKFKQLVIYDTEKPDNTFKFYEVSDGYQYEINGYSKVTGKYTNNKFTMEADGYSLSIEKINKVEYKLVVNNKDEYSDSTFTVGAKSNIENDKQNISLDISYSVYDLDNSRQTLLPEENNNFDINFKIDFSIYKNATTKPISTFITKDISTIDNNEYSDMYEKLEKIMENIYKDIYPGYNNYYSNYSSYSNPTSVGNYSFDYGI